MMEKLTEGIIAANNRKLEEIIADAFHNHFGYSIAFANKMELQHIIVEGEEVQSFQYRHETFLYITDWDIDYDLLDKAGAKVYMKMKYKFV